MKQLLPAQEVLRKCGFAELWETVSQKNTGKGNPYHNNEHALFMVEQFYQGAMVHSLGVYEKKNGVLAAMFHDMNHSGSMTEASDLENIPRALAVADYYITPELVNGAAIKKHIIDLIRATGNPCPFRHLKTTAAILRDADRMQVICSKDWKRSLKGLAQEMGQEWGKPFLEFEIAFLESLRWNTFWGQSYDDDRKKRIRDIRQLARKEFGAVV